MRHSSPRVVLAALLLVATACTGARTEPETAPQPIQAPAPQPGMDPTFAVSHPVNVHLLAVQAMWQHERSAKQDSAIMEKIRAAVDYWNAGDLDRFVFELYGQSATYVGRAGPVPAAPEARRIHAARWFSGGRPAGRLSVRLETAWNLGDDVRLFVCRWTVADAAGREESWISSLSIRNIRSTGWTVVHEHSSLEG